MLGGPFARDFGRCGLCEHTDDEGLGRDTQVTGRRLGRVLEPVVKTADSGAWCSTDEVLEQVVKSGFPRLLLPCKSFSCPAW